MGKSLFGEVGEFVPDKLIADNSIPVTTKGITLAAGEGTLMRGALLGKDSNGEYMLMDGDTITSPDCILTDMADTAESKVITTGYITGTFNRAAVTDASSKDIEDIGDYETEMRKLGIFLSAVQEY